jgi:hypothetical protein
MAGFGPSKKIHLSLISLLTESKGGFSVFPVARRNANNQQTPP